MKTRIALSFLLFFFMLSACEKPIDTEQEKQTTHYITDNDDDDDYGGGDSGDDDMTEDPSKTDDRQSPLEETDFDAEDPNGASASDEDHPISVAQFIAHNFSGGVFVKGYIVGDCTKSIAYAELQPPFTMPQALLLADSPTETDTAKMMSLQLASGSHARQDLNLVDHPELYQRKIRVFGYYTTYLGIPGIKNVGEAYAIYVQ